MWHIIKDDYYGLCNEFFLGAANLECINNSFVTLEANGNNLETISDFRPFSLLNISLKVIN